MGEDGARWKFNLDALGRDMPKIMGFPEIDRAFVGPTLFLRGANSDYILPGSHGAIRQSFPQAEFEDIADAGHWLHAEKPREVQAAVERFLA